jgi:alkylation response protein AidB-like acyl-CoA dehydrogenase
MSDSKHIELVDSIAAIIKENAIGVDAKAEFPKASIDAFMGSGLAGLISSPDVGGMGKGPRACVEVVERIAQLCGSTAMVVQMHYAASAVIEKFGDDATRRAIASGKHLSTLAFSEKGSRSHFWAPLSTATKSSKGIVLDASKTWVTSAGHADSYVWSSKPAAGDGLSSIWLVPRTAAGISMQGTFDGIGLRGNDSRPVTAKGVVIPEANRLGDEGGGFQIMLEVVLPLFNVLMGSVGVGFMEAATGATAAHLAQTGFEHLDNRLCEMPTLRAYVARMRCKTDAARALLMDTVTALETGREDAVLRVLESKAVCGESATEVCDIAMRVCGGMAFRKDVGVERVFRDARAGTVMAPTTDQLYDFIGKAICGMDVF